MLKYLNTQNNSEKTVLCVKMTITGESLETLESHSKFLFCFSLWILLKLPYNYLWPPPPWIFSFLVKWQNWRNLKKSISVGTNWKPSPPPSWAAGACTLWSLTPIASRSFLKSCSSQKSRCVVWVHEPQAAGPQREPSSLIHAGCLHLCWISSACRLSAVFAPSFPVTRPHCWLRRGKKHGTGNWENCILDSVPYWLHHMRLATEPPASFLSVLTIRALLISRVVKRLKDWRQFEKVNCTAVHPSPASNSPD